MSIMLPSALRKNDGDEQPGIKIGMFMIRIPFVHAPFEIAEFVQALVVFVVGVSAVEYMTDIFGLSANVALAIVCVHEIIEAFYGIVGEPLISGWITPAIPLITKWLSEPMFANSTNIVNGLNVDKLYGLIALQVMLGVLYLVLGTTGLASKLVNIVPTSIKAGLLVGAGISAVIGGYGFQSIENGGNGFFKFPVSFSIGVLLSLFLLHARGFKKIKAENTTGLIGFLAKAGFVPAVFAAYIVGVLIGELNAPIIDLSAGIFFDLFRYGKEALDTFSILSNGFPSMQIILTAIPIALMTYIISFGNIVAGGEILKEASKVRPDEHIDVNPNRANVLCGIRNIVQGLFFPIVVMSGPLWMGAQVVITERYKLGQKGMYSIFGGIITFAVMKAVVSLITPMVALVSPILPLGMSLTMMIQAFACFEVSFNMVDNPEARGVAGFTGAMLAIAPAYIALIAGLIISFFIEYLFSPKKDDAEKELAKEAKEIEKKIKA